MRHAYAQKSWFDTLCSAWVKQSFWLKLSVFVGIALITGFVGLWFGAPLLLVVGSIVPLSTHILCLAHEHKRIRSAEMIAQDAVALVQSLKASEEVLKQGSDVAVEAGKELKEHFETMSNNAQIIDEQTKEVKQQQEKLAPEVANATQAIQGLVQAEKKAQAQLENNTASLNQMADETKAHAEDLGAGFVGFGEAVRGIQETQKNYATMVGQFGIFVDSLNSPKTTNDSVDALKAFKDDLTAELDANEALIEAMRKSMNR